MPRALGDLPESLGFRFKLGHLGFRVWGEGFRIYLWGLGFRFWVLMLKPDSFGGALNGAKFHGL